MGLTKTSTKPVEGATQHPAAPAELKDETTAAPATSVAEDDSPAFDTTGSGDTSANAPPTVSQAPGSGMATSGQAKIDDDFSVLDGGIGFGAFPTIKLENGHFVVPGQEDVDEFDCIVNGVRKKWIHKAMEPSEEFFYSENGTHDTGGKTIQQRYAEWKSDGIMLKEVKEYLEIAVLMCSTKMKGEFAILSVPPRSKDRLQGYRMQQWFIKRLKLNEMVTTCKVGAKVTTKAKKVFNPWDFKFKCPATELAGLLEESTTN